MIRNLLLVGAGSCIGGICRFLTQHFVEKYYPSAIPLGTLLVNLLGCFIIGIIYAFAEKGNVLSPAMRVLLAAGFCGGFTTFSSFAYENIRLLQQGEFFFTALYIALSVVVGLAAVYMGIGFVKLVA